MLPLTDNFRMAQEPNQNRKPEPSEPFLQEPKEEPQPPEPFLKKRNRKRNRTSAKTLAKYRDTLSTKEPSEPKTGTARTVPGEQKRHINFFHVNFLCRPLAPGLSQGQTGFAGLPLCKIRRKPGFVQVFTGFVPGTHRVCPEDKPGVVPRPTGQKSLCLCVRWIQEGFKGGFL